MLQICLHPDALGSLLDEVSRYRALTEDESLLLEQIVCRGHRAQRVRIRWTAKMDRQLKLAALSKGGIRRFARDNGLSENAVYQRIAWFKRKSGSGKAAIGAVQSIQIENGGV